MSQKTDRSVDLTDPVAFQNMVQRGLRGILQAQSLLTGILYVELDVLPNSPPPRLHQVGKEYKEIPTVPTQIEAFFEKLSEIDFKKTLDQLNFVLTRLDDRLTELKVGEISDGLTNLITSMDSVVRSPDLTNSLSALHVTLNGIAVSPRRCAPRSILSRRARTAHCRKRKRR